MTEKRQYFGVKRGKCVRREREESEARETASVAFLSWRKELKTVLILIGEEESSGEGGMCTRGFNTLMDLN